MKKLILIALILMLIVSISVPTVVFAGDGNSKWIEIAEKSISLAQEAIEKADAKLDAREAECKDTTRNREVLASAESKLAEAQDFFVNEKYRKATRSAGQALLLSIRAVLIPSPEGECPLKVDGEPCACDCECASGVCYHEVCTTNIGTFNPGDRIPDQVITNALPDGASYFYQITFTADVLLAGTLTSNSGDPNLYIRGESGDIVFESLSIGNERFSEVDLPGGTYYVEVHAYTALDDVSPSILTLATPTEPDEDGDGVPDDQDVCPGFDDTVDSDGDGIPDGCDNCPLTPNPDQEDADSDGIGDACDNND